MWKKSSSDAETRSVEENPHDGRSIILWKCCDLCQTLLFCSYNHNKIPFLVIKWQNSPKPKRNVD